jgi:hypothetical protein
LRNNAAYLILAGTPLPTSNRHASENQGVTVIVSADEWLAPEVAVTVMLELPGGVPVLEFGGALFPPPQLTRQISSAMPPKTAEQRLAFLPRLPILTTRNPNTIPSDHELKVQGRRPVIGTAAEAAAVVLTVRVVETGAPLGVTVAGENVQFEAAGNPLQAKLTGELIPLTGLIVMVNVAVWPAWMVALVGEAAMVKSPLGFPTTKVVVAVAGARTASPGYSAEIT